MAGQRLTDKTALADNPTASDLLMVVDSSDTTGSAEGTSKSILNKYVIQTDSKNVSLDLNSNPVNLVDAPGVGFIIQPITITAIVTYVSTGTTQANYLYISYDSSSTTNYLARQRNFFKDETASRTYIFSSDGLTPSDGTYAGSINNKPLKIYANVDFTGDFTIQVLTTYQIVKL
tara:strand:+ start:236 stop:760 length:525 start_codon:yes stop_codon:yes gene_type:complete